MLDRATLRDWRKQLAPTLVNIRGIHTVKIDGGRLKIIVTNGYNLKILTERIFRVFKRLGAEHVPVLISPEVPVRQRT